MSNNCSEYVERSRFILNERDAKKNVLKFAQSKTKTKIFRHDYPITEELRQSLVLGVAKDFMEYNQYLYNNIYLAVLEEYAEDHHVRSEKNKDLMGNLFFWRLLYDTNQLNDHDFVEGYISEKYSQLRKSPLILSWLREWKKAVPKFYYVGHQTVDCSFVMIDMVEEEPIEVIMYDPLTTMPKNGEIVMGTLLPLGDDLYFPVTEFYRFDNEAREYIVRTLLHHYHVYNQKTSTKYEAFIHVLSVMLQIENKIFCGISPSN